MTDVATAAAPEGARESYLGLMPPRSVVSCAMSQTKRSKAPSPATVATQPETIAAGLRTVFRIAEMWSLNYAETRALLGQPSRATYYKWKSGDVARTAYSFDLATRLGLILGIYKSLQLLYDDTTLADRWLKTPNDAFAGQSAMARMAAGHITDLAAVRDYLDSVRGGR